MSSYHFFLLWLVSSPRERIAPTSPADFYIMHAAVHHRFWVVGNLPARGELGPLSTGQMHEAANKIFENNTQFLTHLIVLNAKCKFCLLHRWLSSVRLRRVEPPNRRHHFGEAIQQPAHRCTRAFLPLRLRRALCKFPSIQESCAAVDPR